MIYLSLIFKSIFLSSRQIQSGLSFFEKQIWRIQIKKETENVGDFAIEFYEKLAKCSNNWVTIKPWNKNSPTSTNNWQSSTIYVPNHSNYSCLFNYSAKIRGKNMNYYWPDPTMQNIYPYSTSQLLQVRSMYDLMAKKHEWNDT